MGTLYFCHIAKCGGLSFRRLLEDKYGANNCFDIFEFFCEHEKYLNCERPVVYGHAPYNLHELMKDPVDVITILRDPVDRLVSYWKHVYREKQDVLIKHCYEFESAEEIISDPIFFKNMSNAITRVFAEDVKLDDLLSNCLEIEDRQKRTEYWSQAYRQRVLSSRIDVLKREHIDLAKKRLSNVRFGFQEDYRKTVLPLIGVKKSVHVNTAPSDQSSVFDTPEARRMLADLHVFDYELIEFAHELYSLNEKNSSNETWATKLLSLCKGRGL